MVWGDGGGDLVAPIKRPTRGRGDGVGPPGYPTTDRYGTRNLQLVQLFLQHIGLE